MPEEDQEPRLDCRIGTEREDAPHLGDAALGFAEGFGLTPGDVAQRAGDVPSRFAQLFFPHQRWGPGQFGADDLGAFTVEGQGTGNVAGVVDRIADPREVTDLEQPGVAALGLRPGGGA